MNTESCMGGTDVRAIRSERGMTLVETAIAAAAATMIFAALGAALGRTTDEAHLAMIRQGLHAEARTALALLSRDIGDSGFTRSGDYVFSHPTDRGGDGPRLELARRVGEGDEPNAWSEPITYELRAAPGETPANGVDDDRDGLTDESQFVRVEGARTTVLADGVLEARFRRAAGERSISVRLVLARRLGDGAALTRTVATRIAMRNGA